MRLCPLCCTAALCSLLLSAGTAKAAAGQQGALGLRPCLCLKANTALRSSLQPVQGAAEPDALPLEEHRGRTGLCPSSPRKHAGTVGLGAAGTPTHNCVQFWAHHYRRDQGRATKLVKGLKQKSSGSGQGNWSCLAWGKGG